MDEEHCVAVLRDCAYLEHVAHKLRGRGFLDWGHPKRPSCGPPERPGNVMLVGRRGGGISREED